MTPTREAEIAAYMGADLELLPHIPELLADYWALGSYPDLIVEVLRSVSLPPATTRVLDLGCGKGAVSITLAQELGFQAIGVDAFEPFIDEANARAAELGVSSLCQFVCDDLREVLLAAAGFDVVIYASVGVLGALSHCVAQLRECVRTGGYMLIQDGYLQETAAAEGKHPGRFARYEESRAQLTGNGDTLIAERLIAADEAAQMNREYIRRVERRAADVLRVHPELSDNVGRFVSHQKSEAARMTSIIRTAIWLLRKRDG